MVRIALAALAAALLIAPAAHADPVALLDAPKAQDIALAGSEVIVPRPGARGCARRASRCSRSTAGCTTAGPRSRAASC